jgi:hypothetical protein
VDDWYEWFRRQVSVEGPWANALALFAFVVMLVASGLAVWTDSIGRPPAWLALVVLYLAIAFIVNMVLAWQEGGTTSAAALAAMAVAGLMLWVGWLLASSQGPAAVWWIVTGLVLTLGVLSHYFTRRLVLSAALLSALLVLVAVVRVGQVATKADLDAEVSAQSATSADGGIEPEPESLLDLVSTGADEVLGTLPVFGDADVPAEITLTGWLVLGGATLILFRRIVIHASRRGMGPVLIDCADEDEKAVLRTYIANNLPEPGSVPGADAIRPITDLLAIGTGPAAGGISKVLNTIVGIIDVPSGYRVEFTALTDALVRLDPSGGATPDDQVRGEDPNEPDLIDAALYAEHADRSGAAERPRHAEPGDLAELAGTPDRPGLAAEGDPTSTTSSGGAPAAGGAPAGGTIVDAGAGGKATPDAVSVVVCDNRTKEQIAQRVVLRKQGQSGEALWRTAGYWAATIVLDRSLDVPPWAHWRPGASDSLATYFSIRDTGRKENLPELARALSRAPDNGVMLMRAAATYDLNDQPVESFRLALRAACTYPNYLLARYRLSIAASALACRLDDWCASEVYVRDEICDALTRYRGLAAKQAAEEMRAMEPGGRAPMLVRFGKVVATSMARDLACWRLVPGILRRPERTTTLGLFAWDDGYLSSRRRLRDLARSIAVTCAIREIQSVQRVRWNPSPVEDEAYIVKRALESVAGWQLAYNVACLYGIRAGMGSGERNRDLAFEYFWMALERPGSTKLSARWVLRDPALVPLHTDPRFAELLRRTGGGQAELDELAAMIAPAPPAEAAPTDATPQIDLRTATEWPVPDRATSKAAAGTATPAASVRTRRLDG